MAFFTMILIFFTQISTKYTVVMIKYSYIVLYSGQIAIFFKSLQINCIQKKIFLKAPFRVIIFRKIVIDISSPP